MSGSNRQGWRNVDIDLEVYPPDRQDSLRSLPRACILRQAQNERGKEIRMSGGKGLTKNNGDLRSLSS